MQRKPINKAPKKSIAKGNMLSMGGNMRKTFYNKPQSDRVSGKSIKYKIVSTHVFKNVSQKDLDIQKKYAINIISEYHNVKEQYLHLKYHKNTKSLTSIDRVYYVKMGERTIGKLSMREQHTFRTTDLIIIYQIKKHVRTRQTKRRKKHGED